MTKKDISDIHREFERIGRALFISGLNNSHSGNMSIRVGNRIFITRRGSMLGFLQEQDIIETGLDENDSNIALASSETGVHRAIYKGTPSLAIIHSHPLTAVALSLLMDEIIPIDVEGSYIIHKVPVLNFEYGSASKEMEKELPKALAHYKIVLVHGHGAFAVGNFLEDALHYTHSLENIAKIIYIVKVMGGNLNELQKADYLKW